METKNADSWLWPTHFPEDRKGADFQKWLYSMHFLFCFFLNQMLVLVTKTTDSTETTDKAYKSQLWWFLEYSHLL